MKHQQYNKQIQFVKEPVEFNKYTPRELLGYCLGGNLYMPSSKDMAEKIIQKSIPGLTTMTMCFEDAIGEEDLAQALRLKKLAGASLDELCTSPEQSPLIGLDNVICTPHIGGSTLDINDEMARVCIEHILTVRRGEKLVPPALVNGEELK